MLRILFYGILLFAISACGGGSSIDPFSRKRADGKIPVSMDLIREQVRKELAGTPEEIATKERWQVIENDFNACRLSSKETDSRKAQEVFNQCMSDKGYLYLDQINAEYLHGEIYDEEAAIVAKIEKEHEIAELQNKKNSILINAVKSNDTKTILKSIMLGANPNVPDNKDKTALMHAVIDSHSLVVDLLLLFNANPNAQNSMGFTALMLAVFKDRAEIVKILLDKGANLNTQNNEGKTALMIASLGSHAEIVKILLDRGAHLNTRDNTHFTALMIAAFLENANIAKILLNCGANPEIKHQDGFDAWDIAKQNLVVLPIFEEYQQKIDSGWRPKSCKRG